MSQHLQFYGLTQAQFDYLAQNYTDRGFIPDTSRINNYTNPLINIADRNWQEHLRMDPGYNWTASDRISWKQNCEFGPHNAASQIDSMIFKN